MYDIYYMLYISMSDVIYDRTNDRYMEFIEYVEFMIQQHQYDTVIAFLDGHVPSPLIMFLKDKVYRRKKAYESRQER